MGRSAVNGVEDTPALEVRALHMAIRGRTILDVDRWVVAAAGLVVVEGEAGSGKTAMAAALSGSAPASGSVLVAGQALRVTASSRVAAGLAAAVRDGGRIAGCRAGEALTVAAGRNGRATSALERFPLLAARRDVQANVLSGGEQQLLQVVCAWCTGPSVLVLDSPTVGLASDVAAAVVDLARDTAAGGAVVIWLDQDVRAAPFGPTWRLVKGRLIPLESQPAV